MIRTSNLPARRMLNVLAAVVGLCAQIYGGAAALAQTDTPRLTGQVTSSDEGAMEGVLVSAQQLGSPITVTVVSGHSGQFTFPPAKLRPGRYALRIRAVGYDLDSPQYADLSAEQATTVDLKLRKTEDLASQLTSTEWLISMPGTADQKRPLIECMSCHTLERVVRSTFTAQE